MVGNRWYKCDLHVHSSASECFRDKTVTADQWVDECISKGLNCVALTDHNTGKNIDEYKRVAEKSGLLFFPGVEITCGDQGTHLLVIFDINADTNKINDFLVRMNIDREDFAKSSACSTKSVISVVDAANEEGALVIPAHIDEFNGLSEIRHSWLTKVLEKTEISAVQVVQKELYENRYVNLSGDKIDTIKNNISERYGKKIDMSKIKLWHKGVYEANDKNLSIVSFSDNPHEEGDSKHGLWGIGRRYTYIKMSDDPNVLSLKEAFQFNNIRVVPDFEKFENDSKELVLNKLTIENTILNDKELIVNFSRSLTTVIGGRGTGKSCITRFLLYVLGKEDELGPFSEISREFSKFIQIDDGNTGVLKLDSEITLEVSYLGEKYIISRNGQNHEIFLIKDGEKLSSDYERLIMISSKIDLYAQKQIYEISKSQDSIRDILDSYNSEEVTPLKKLIRETELSIKKIMREINSLTQEIKDKKTIELKKEDIKKQLDKLSENKYKVIIDNYRNYNTASNAINKDIENLNNIINGLTNEIIHCEFEEISDINPEIFVLRKDLNETLNIRKEVLKETLKEMKNDLNDYEIQIKQTKWFNEFSKYKIKYQELKEELTEDELKKVSNLDSLTKELSDLEQNMIAIFDKEKSLEKKKEFLISYQEELGRNYKNLSNKRRVFINKIFSKISGLSVELSPQRDFEDYIMKFREITNKQETFDSEFNIILDQLTRNKIKYSDLYSEIENSDDESNGSIITDTRLIRSLKKLREEQLIELKTLVPSDVIRIALNVKGKKVKLSNASAGQRTSAILSMILAYGESPLIMDQPEDDLDSQLINTLIVNSLVLKKENRQIIIITHNPNIPVNGDSEWVVCMGDTKKITINSHGSVDNTNIKEKICDVMEGGQDAFAKRARRYGFKETLS